VVEAPLEVALTASLHDIPYTSIPAYLLDLSEDSSLIIVFVLGVSLGISLYLIEPSEKLCLINVGRKALRCDIILSPLHYSFNRHPTKIFQKLGTPLLDRTLDARSEQRGYKI